MQPDKRHIAYNNGNDIEHPFNDESFANYSADFENNWDDFDDEDESSPFTEIDFSELEGGNFKSKLSKLSRKIDTRQNARAIKSKSGNRLAKKLQSSSSRLAKKNPTKVIVPTDRQVIIQGVSQFILGNKPEDEAIKRIGYYKGRRLDNLTLVFQNTNPQPFSLELFNPTMPLQYLLATGLNLDDKITVAGGTTKYSELLFNLLANPTMIIGAQIVVTATIAGNDTAQYNESLQFKNKNIGGFQAIEPLNTNLYRDTMQVQSNILNFDIMRQLKRPFVPDGMDTIVWRILAGNSVTINFFYKQVQIKRMVFEECRRSKNLL